ncbi:alkyldihydroxyacetonephosphate synthase [Nocardioides baekrokdamisoli]|uniref:Alkyldihydroxyacetonephosphate synthase n=2 Tax=Nocardioides baekrokdamisoli TaxID=1804624 RepID=A0A3G9IW68_9ACTN|nr:alkyldihydroxyacetonephosphate synthase [Nocardioides baekrokdamisoli]
MHPQRWGSPSHAAPLPESTQGLVEFAFGAFSTPALDMVTLPDSGLDEGALAGLRGLLGAENVLTDDETRRLRTRGKSTPDLLKARTGDLSDAPDAVVRPGSHDDVVKVLAWAVEQHVAVVPFGGGTSVTGGLVARRDGYAGLISLDLIRLNQLLSVDPISMTATLQPGMRGPEAEAALAQHGMTLGHFPQSFEFASIGGFAATRSSGQNSAGFGRFDQMVVGLRMATPIGDLISGSSPLNAAGPDLRQVAMGSEGTFGVITEVTVRVRAIATGTAYEAWRFDSFSSGQDAMRHLAQNQILPTIIRLSDETETALNLASQTAVGAEAPSGCLMIVGYEGASIDNKRAVVTRALTALGGTSLGEERGKTWLEGRFHAPYLRDSMLDSGVLVETLETATFWSNTDRLYSSVKTALGTSLGEGALVLCHVSHVYETGCSLYFTVAAKQGDNPLERWLAAKAAASDAMIESGATITHHHAVGTDHKAWLEREIGPVGVAILRGIKAAVDPTGILNPGVLIP